MTDPRTNPLFSVKIQITGTLADGKKYEFATGGSYSMSMSRKVLANVLRAIARDIDPRPPTITYRQPPELAKPEAI